MYMNHPVYRGRRSHSEIQSGDEDLYYNHQMDILIAIEHNVFTMEICSQVCISLCATGYAKMCQKIANVLNTC